MRGLERCPAPLEPTRTRLRVVQLFRRWAGDCGRRKCFPGAQRQRVPGASMDPGVARRDIRDRR